MTSAAGGGSAGGGRYLFLDGLRGIAATMVAFDHYYNLTKRECADWMPGWLASALDNGWIGVEIFFVLSGFVIAYSVRNARIGPRFVGNFALRRAIRLDPPYWATIALWILLLWLSELFLGLQDPNYPGVGKLLAHLVYMQRILGFGDIVYVFWTLCLEVQFYLVLIILLGLLQWAVGRAGAAVRGVRTAFGVLLGAMAILSMACGFGLVEPPRGLFISHWYMFFLGSLTWWVLNGQVARWWLGLYLGLYVAFLGFRFELGSVTALITGSTILVVGRLGRLRTWLGFAPIQFLGRISYSLYLIHPLVAVRVRGVGRRVFGMEQTPLEWTIVVLAAFAVSILAAVALYRLVERPALRLAHRIKLK